MKISSKNKIRIQSVSVLVLILILLTGFRLMWLHYNVPINQPKVIQGVMDLREYDIVSDAPVVINDKLYFLPNELTLDKSRVIAYSRNESFDSEETSSFNYGTYYFKVLLPKTIEDDQLLSIRVPSSSTASSLYVNGKLVAQTGNAANSSVKHIGRGNPYTASFVVPSDEIEIILHVSNFDTPEVASVSTPIIIGSLDQVSRAQSKEEALVIGMVVILCLHSLYSFLIFIFISRKPIFIIFGFGFLFPAFDELFTYSSVYLNFLSLSYNEIYRFRTIVYLGAAFFFIVIVKTLLADAERYNRFKLIYTCYSTAALLLLILPIQLLIPFEYVLYVLYIASFIGVIPLALKEYFKARNESFLIAIVVLGTTSGILWGFIKAISGINIPFYPFDYLVAFLSFASFWFLRFYNQTKQVNRLVEDLEQADLQKDEYLALTSHELRNPLHGLINIAQTVLDDKKEELPQNARKNLELLIQVANRMNFIISDLQDFTRLKDQRIRLTKEVVNLAAVSHAVVDMLRFMTDGKKIDFMINIPESARFVYADKNRVIQILFNLIHNAVKFTKEGDIVITSELNGDEIALSIKDNGIGIDMDQQSRIFSPYEQIDTEKPFQQGMGLGLNICKNLVELHGGTLSLKSRINEGATFTFTLPKSSKTKKFEEADTSSTSIGLETPLSFYTEELVEVNEVSMNPRILIIDDDAVNLKIMKDLLSGDYELHCVSNAEEALKVLYDYDWDLIISDVMVPGMSGYALTQKIRQEFSLSELPILLLTARQTPQDVYTGFMSGANDYVAKPVVALELKSRVKALATLKQSIKDQLTMEAALLHAQIQPHFLFNTLNSIASLSTVDIKRMSKLLDEFANYLRKSFKSFSTSELIPFEEEVSLVESYLYIEKERFGKRLLIIWDLDENLDIQIPPFALQTVVENSVRHGLLPKVDGGTITIRSICDEKFVKVEVIDNGVGMSLKKIEQIFEESTNPNAGIGLPNTQRRMKQLLGHNIEIESVPNHHTVVRFTIPK